MDGPAFALRAMAGYLFLVARFACEETNKKSSVFADDRPKQAQNALVFPGQGLKPL